MSLNKTIISSNSSTPLPVSAEIGTKMVSPPQSSASRLYSVNSCLILSGDAPGLSILFTATMIGTPAA